MVRNYVKKPKIQHDKEIQHGVYAPVSMQLYHPQNSLPFLLDETVQDSMVQ